MTLPPLYAIVDQAAAARAGFDLVTLATAYLAGGASVIQVRAKTLASGLFADACRAIVSAAHRAGAQVLVNDRADIALVAGADGVHVGQTDLLVEDVRGLIGAGGLVGISTHTRAQVDEAVRTSASYVAVGPVFGTTTKDTGYDAVGLDLVRYAVGKAGGRPVVAIGGITLDRAPAVLAAGATSVAVIGDLLAGGRPEARVREWIASIGPAGAAGSPGSPGSPGNGGV